MRVALKYTGLLVMVLASAFAFGQNYRQGVTQGNKLYENQEYAKAAEAFEKAANANNEGYEAPFNLGDALFKQEKYEEAAEAFF